MSENNGIRKQLRMEEASASQLREFAESQLGLTIHHASNSDTIIKKIKEAWDKDYIMVVQEAVPGEELPVPMVTIRISQQEGEGGKRAVPVSVNGVQYQIRRDEDVPVPYPVYENLRNANQSVFDYEIVGTVRTLAEKTVRSYPFDVVNMPSKVEIEAWKASRPKQIPIQSKAA